MRHYVEELKKKEEDLQTRMAGKEQTRKQQELIEERQQKQRDEEERLAKVKSNEQELIRKQALASSITKESVPTPTALKENSSVSSSKPFSIASRKSQPS